MMCSIEKQNIYFYSIVFDIFSEINNHVCTVYYSVVGLKICTIQCSVISVETVLFFSPATSRPVVIFGPPFLCPAFSCPAIWSVTFTSCNFMPCNFDGPSFSRPAFSVNPILCHCQFASSSLSHGQFTLF